MTNKFIDLNRSFAPIPKDREFNEDNFDLSYSFGLLETKKWDDLLLLRRVIILAEAGAGKTEEIRTTTERLRNDGHKAFFFRLEHLNSDFEASFEIGNNPEFEKWLSLDESGWFFLDSVDEARLRGPKEFEAAIRKFGIKLGDHKQHAHIFITSRISEWRAQADLSLIKDHIPFTDVATTTQEQDENQVDSLDGRSEVLSGSNIRYERKPPTPIEPSVFALRPLDRDQIRVFSQAFGIQDIETFLAAIEKAEADIFSGRPQDLMDLINYWKKFGEIANRAELIETSISSKLMETDPDRAAAFPLTIEQAKLGAEMLAAAVTFQKKSRILVPEQNADMAIRAESIDVKSILTSWEDKQARALLQRPIFDEAIYGTVRFHHRSVPEYLTAKWLHRLLLNGKPRRPIEALFFKECYGRMVVVPSIHPILSWLILFDDRIREKTTQIAPEVFIQGGDPSALPIDVRKNMLKRFCSLYSNQRVTDLSFDISEVRRFAHTDLGETINRLLHTYSGHGEIRQLLLRMVWQGEIESCAAKALDFALDDANDTYTRIYGIRAVEASGSIDQKNNLVRALINDPAFKNEQLIGELISALAPDILQRQDVLTLIQRVDKYEEYSDRRIRHYLKEFFLHKCPEEDIFGWICDFIPLLKESPVIERRFFEVSQKYNWLLPIVVLAVERLVRTKHPKVLDENILEIISLAQAERHFTNYHSDKHDLADLIPKWPELNRALFWFDVSLERRYLDKKRGERLTDWWRVGFSDHYWRFTGKDFEKILEDINKESLMDDRLVALSLSFYLYIENGRKKTHRLLLKEVVRGVPALENALNLYLKPLPLSQEQRRSRRQMADFKKREIQRKRTSAANRKKWQKWLQEHTGVLRDTSIAPNGNIWHATNYLLNILRDKRPDRNKWSEPNWEDLVPEFGQEVAEAYRDGCLDYWRKYHPQIRSEGYENTNSTPTAVIVGLSGLGIEARRIPDWPRNLSGDEVALACRYAVNELNGFPDWLPRLHSVFPDIVEAGILTEIEWEFSKYDMDTDCHYVLDDVVWQLDWLKPKISNQILSFLKNYEPKYGDTVRKAIEIILSCDGLNKTDLVNIAKTKFRGKISTERQALWLAAWMCVDAQGALKALTSCLGNTIGDKQSTELSIFFIVALLGDSRRHIPSKHQDYLQPEILLSLIKVMHRYIRTKEDINRAGTGAYSPGIRDHAQDARNRLFQLLKDIPGKPTYLALMDLAQHHPDEKSRQWYAVNAKRRAEVDAEIEPWSPGDIAHFTEDAERAPQNHRELYDLAIYRLLDLKADLEEGDTSIAEILAGVKDEPKYRNIIGGWLRDRSFGRYSVPQEEELTDAKKPDIRIHGVGFDGPVPIELKVVDNNWTATKLLERLRNQLCGDYLRDPRSNCGIFLLIYRGQKKNWRHPKTGKALNFVGLTNLLEREAHKITAKDKKVEALELVNIDLTKRFLPSDIF